jgi:MtN3 and saliva related transmembrane protein
MISATEFIGYGAAVCTTICYIPQAIHVVYERKTAGISLLAYFTLFIGALLWTTYGILLGNWPLILANGITLPLIFTVLVMKIRLG